ncbi:MAG TPA: alkaline phosphatase family protein [Candidatus Limnocylindrales bacterium]
MTATPRPAARALAGLLAATALALGPAVGPAVLAASPAPSSAPASPAASSSGPAPSASGAPTGARAQAGASAAPSLGTTPTGQPIQHVVVLLQENHTFDNYFGTFPGADGFKPGTCLPVDPAAGAQPCVAPYHLQAHRTVDLGHGNDVALGAYDNGRMDGFIKAQSSRNLPGNVAMGYYDGSDLPYYWNLARDYVLADHFFSSAMGSSETNHMFWVAARPNQSVLPAGGYDFPTIFDRLQDAGVSWKFYVQNYDPTITYRNREPASSKAAQLVWAPLLSFGRFLDDPARHQRIVDLQQYYADLDANQLPAVSFIAPSGASEHPPGDITIGQTFGTSLITSLMRSPAWASSLFVLTWDDWGGWYDHVIPPQVDSDGYGFRVPALFVSPFTRGGGVDHTTYDFSSILRFIENNWGLDPLTARDAAASSIGVALRTDRPGAAPRFPPAAYPAVPPIESRHRIELLVVYGVVMGLAIVGSLLLVYSPRLAPRLLLRRRPGGGS